jgi:hypothetical protein
VAEDAGLEGGTVRYYNTLTLDEKLALHGITGISIQELRQCAFEIEWPNIVG